MKWRTFGAALRGAALGLAASLALGQLIAIVLTVARWPGPEADTAERARVLGASISEGMHCAEVAMLVLVPVFTITRVRRPRLPRR